MTGASSSASSLSLASLSSLVLPATADRLDGLHAFIQPDQDETKYADTIAPEPSLEFSRKTWWDNLLNVYSHTREAAA